VVFDLDETLIHCNDTLTPPYDVKLPITFPTGEVIEAGINIRPYAHEILKNLSRHFEVIVFTASHSCYANVVLDYLDPNNEYIQHRLFRDHCYQTPEGMYCKDLRVMDRDLSKMVLVDNAAYSYAAQPDNGIPILPYYHGKTDFELKALERYLMNMVTSQDVRQHNRQTFQFHLYRNYYSDPERLVEEIYMKEEH
jgi:CTD small phosphatase-like protein 2